ncbi:hypothetical protein ACFORO_10050 [Amycolatopsis halotolerans]|uniref:Uncharacterized protein n=1 Tax=Amycolatopsis halotolerans TaxID=330083 RepID=A0ABV7QG86_9PSEU
MIASGSASTTVPEALPGELSEACELCSGVVMLDLARCDIDGGTAVAPRSTRADTGAGSVS